MIQLLQGYKAGAGGYRTSTKTADPKWGWPWFIRLYRIAMIETSPDVSQMGLCYICSPSSTRICPTLLSARHTPDRCHVALSPMPLNMSCCSCRHRLSAFRMHC